RVGFSDWGCYGGTSTPTIDKLADDGVRFTNFYAGGSDPEKSLWCLTTSAHGGHVLGSRTTRNLYDAMWLGGYATAFIGLWKQSGSPLDIGAEEFVGFLSKTPVSSFPEEVAVDRATLRILANRGESKKFSCDQLLANEVKTYLDRARRTPRQFFLHVVLPSQASFQNGPKGRAPTDIRTDDAQRLDQFMASLLQALEQTGLAHRSVILLTGLSGIPPESDGAQNSEWSSKTHGLAEGNLRLPFIIRSPRRFPVKESPALAAMWDLYPTFLEWGVVQRRVPGMNGASLIPILRGEEKSRQELLYWRTDDGAAQAVRREEWKAVYLATEKSLRLYNLSQDPGETTNVAQEHPKVVERMLAK
ncbi:MAG: sulfatase-like hydrolase/transferase, partial [Planctomycetaceae bacterium]|nr:sulfatase-like hydrolase/transferase [Planctomycetaceae bacterium]